MRGLLTTVALTAGLLVVPTTARAADQCVDGATFNVTAEPLTYRSAQVVIGVGAACSDEAVTVQRADGTNTQVVPLPSILTGPFPTTGDFYAPVENGAGTWLITHVHHGSITYKLPTPSRFVVKRGVRVQVPSTVLTLPGQAVAVSGRADYYTSTGGQLPLANRVVEVSGRPLGGTGRETVLTRTRTDSSGLFRFNLRLTYETSLSVRVWTGSTIIANGYAPSQLRFRPRPTWLTGTAAPTTATVVRPGTKNVVVRALDGDVQHRRHRSVPRPEGAGADQAGVGPDRPLRHRRHCDHHRQRLLLRELDRLGRCRCPSRLRLAVQGDRLVVPLGPVAGRPVTDCEGAT